MKTNEKTIKSNCFGELTERESYWILIDLIRRNCILSTYEKIAFKEQVSLFDSVVNGWVDVQNQPVDESIKKVFCDDILTRCKQAILPLNEFEWIDFNDERLCYFVWLYVNKFPPLQPQVNTYAQPVQQVHPLNSPLNHFNTGAQVPQQSALSTNFFPPLSALPPVNNANNIVTNPTNSASRVKEVIRKFDVELFANHDFKKQYIERVKNNWSECLLYKRDHRWIDRTNETQITWAWEHLPARLFSFFQQPTSIDEQYLAIVGAIDTWSGHPADLAQIIDKAKRAWSQKKHRDKRGDKKAYSFVISQEAKSNLDAIARLTEKKLSDVIEEVIYKEVERLKAVGVFIDDT